MQSNPIASVSTQRGASVSGVVFIIVALGVFIKLAVAILPAQVGNYQLEKTIAEELKRANGNNVDVDKFMSALQRQLSINSYDVKPAEILTFTNDRPGSLAVHMKYEVANNFFANVDIVNRFEKDITATDVN